MFLETSAIVEFLSVGSKVNDVARKIDEAETSFCVGPTVEFEAISVLSAKMGSDVETARGKVLGFISGLQATRMTITPEIGEMAVDAFARYGKGRGHPARLNFGDCFSYAMAKSAGVPLLYVGDDFAQTDLA